MTSKLGIRRNAPISQPRYQSGCAPFVPEATWYGPHCQIGLIWTSPPSRKRTPATASASPIDFGAWPGNAGVPTYPGQTPRSLGLFLGVAGVLFLLGGLVQINPIWLWGPYHVADGTNGAQPDWYLCLLYTSDAADE